jgi:DNA mismatch endonuclease (patch repair protein)
MSQVKGRDTKPELAVRRIVSGLGFRYRLHSPGLPGKPDLVFGRIRKIIFVHGCFWHGHARCRYGNLPKSRVSFWEEKVATNRMRDRKTLRQLNSLGWESLVVWQCELRRPENLMRKIRDFLAKK